MSRGWAAEMVAEAGQVRVVDVGARAIAGHDPPYEALVGMELAELVGIEPDALACAELRRRYPRGRFHAVAAGDGSERRLHVCRMASKSSLFPPNPDCIALFQTFGHGMEVEAERAVTTVRLDSLDDAGDADWLTMDVQGAEGLVLDGAAALLATLGVLQLEVEFVEQYTGQPLFGDLDVRLRRAGLMFHGFLGYGTRAWRPMIVGGDPTAGIHQWLWSDAVYVAHPRRWAALSSAKLLKTALVMHSAYGSWDVAYALCAHVDERDGGRRAAAYLDALQEAPAAVAA